METPDDEVARLDMAARAEVGDRVASSLRWTLLIVSLFIGAVAIGSEAAPNETFFVRVMAVYAVLTTVILWGNWRYKLYLPVFLALACAFGSQRFRGSSHTSIESTADSVGLFICLGAGYAFWKHAGPYATANAPGWEKERSQAKGCLQVLTTPARAKEVIEFSTGSFWTGYYTYRLMNPGPYWAIARFKRGNMRRLIEYRIRDLSAVTFRKMPAGELQITIGAQTIHMVGLSPQIFDDVEQPLQPRSAA